MKSTVSYVGEHTILSVPLDYLLEHSFGSYPYASFTIHGLINHDILQCLRMLGDVKDTINVALEMSVVFFHAAIFCCQWSS